MRTINARFFFVLLGAAALTAAALFGVHRFQTGRIAAALLWQCDHNLDAGDLEQAIKYLDRYLEFRPDDTDAMTRLGGLMERRAFGLRQNGLGNLYERVLRNDPQREPIRRKLVEVYLSLHRFTDAQPHLELLLADHPDDAGLQEENGICLEATARFEQAADAFRKAVAGNGQRLDAYGRLAWLLRGQLGQAQPAEEVINELVAKNPDNPDAYLMRFEYRRKFGAAEGTGAADLAARMAADADQALKLAPEHAGALLVGAELAEKDGRIDQARAHLEKGLSLHPQNLRMIRQLAFLEHQTGHMKRALEILQRGVEQYPDDPDLLTYEAEMALDEGRPERVLQVIKQLEDRRAAFDPRRNVGDQIDYLKALVAMRDGRWGEATATLERLRTAALGQPVFAERFNLLLADCYGQLGNADLRADAIRRALGIDANSVAGRLAEAGLLASQGRLDEAIREYQAAARDPLAPLSASVMALKLQISRRRYEERAGTWDDLERAVRELAGRVGTRTPPPPELADVRLLAVDILVARRQLPEAARELEKLRKEFTKEVSVWSASVEFTRLTQSGPAALKLLDQADQACGDRVDLRLLRADLWSRLPQGEPLRLLPTLAANADRFSGSEAARLFQGLAHFHQKLDDPAGAERLLQTAARTWPNDLTVQVRLFDLYQRRDFAEGMAAVVREVSRLEGPTGTMHDYLEARRLGESPRSGAAERTQARALLDQLVQKRARWAPAHQLRARIAERLGDLDAAAQGYQQAISFGDSDPETFAGLVRVLIAAGKPDQAEQAVQAARAMTALSPSHRLAVYEAVVPELAKLSNGRPLTAVLLRGVTDYQEHLMVGRLLWRFGYRGEAIEAYRQAVELGGGANESWVYLLRAITQSEAPDKVERLLNKGRRELPEEQLTRLQAMRYEAARDWAKAIETYDQAVRERPRDAQTREQFAKLLLSQGRRAEALVHLQTVIDGKTDAGREHVAWARRTAAMALNASHRPADFVRADALMATNQQEFGDSAEDRRVLAGLLSARMHYLPAEVGQKAFRQAAALLEELLKTPDGTRQDRFALAQLYDSVGQWDKARPLLEELLQTDPDNLTVLSFTAERLLQRKDAAGAGAKVERMARVAGADPRTLRWKARLLILRKADADALTALAGYRDGVDVGAADASARAVRFVDLVESVLADSTEASPATRDALRRLAIPLAEKCAERRLEAVIRLMGLLARDADADEALDFLQRTRAKLPPAVFATAAVAAVRTSSNPAAHYDRVRGWVAADLRISPATQQPLFRLIQAELDNATERFAEAERAYQAVLRSDGNNIFALNNLAWLLAHQPQRAAEAQKLIGAAIQQRGPSSELLDTRAKVSLALNEPEAAVQDLEEAIAVSPTAERYFHLALAHRMANHPEAARYALRLAAESGLTPRDIHPADRELCRQMLAADGLGN
jgi:tetratricopeptide (TPR) repeat protein